MNALILLNVPAGVDSAAVVTEAARQVGELLSSFGVPAEMAAQVAGLLSGVPIIALVLLTKLPVLQWASPWLHHQLDPWWERNKTWALPIIAVLVSLAVTHRAELGLMAVGLHQSVMGVVRAATRKK